MSFSSDQADFRLTPTAPQAVALNRGLYRIVRDATLALWNASWIRLDVPVYWRGTGPTPLPDPNADPMYFLDNEIDFGREIVRAFGGGRNANDRCLFGSVLLRVFAARSLMEEDEALDLMDAAAAIYRSTRTADGNLSFINGSGFDVGPTEDGNWYGRGQSVFFEMRFIG